MLHCVIFLRITGCPPRSETPFTISSFASTVPNAGHQLTSLSAKYVSLYFSKISCLFMSEYDSQSSAVNGSTVSSQTAFTLLFPSFSNTAIRLDISSALSVSVLYQELNNWIKIHCVHL